MEFQLGSVPPMWTDTDSLEDTVHELTFHYEAHGPWGCPVTLHRRFHEMPELVAGQTSCAFDSTDSRDWDSGTRRMNEGFFGVRPTDETPDWRRHVNFSSPLCVQTPWWSDHESGQLWLPGTEDFLFRLPHRADPLFRWYCGGFGLLALILMGLARARRRVRCVLFSRSTAKGFRDRPETVWQVASPDELQTLAFGTGDDQQRLTIHRWGPLLICSSSAAVDIWRPGLGWRKGRRFHASFGTCIQVGSGVVVLADEDAANAYTVQGVRRLFERKPSTWRAYALGLLLAHPVLGALTAGMALYLTFVAANHELYFATRQGFILLSVGLCAVAAGACRMATRVVRFFRRPP